MRQLRLLLVLASVLLVPRSAAAHPVPFSFLDLRLDGPRLEGTLTVHVYDLAHDLHVERAEQLLDPAVAGPRVDAIQRMLAARLRISADEETLTPSWSAWELVPGKDSLRLHFHVALAPAPGTIQVAAHLFPYDPEHQTFVNVYEGEALQSQAILDARRTSVEYVSGSSRGRAAIVRRFLGAGIHHILIGPDHLLFLVGLLLLGGSVRRLVALVSAFTVAHSVTLSLAALNLLSPPSRMVEPLIALSIVYVGADNLLVRGGRDARTWIAFVFGLVHGFGFASVLREMALPAGALGWSLFSFNAGVEVGQLMVVAVVASALALLRQRSPEAGRRLAFAGSLVVVVAGAFWFVQRVFFFGGSL